MSTTIQTMGVKIYCKSAVTPTSSIGLYTDTPYPVFRWIENDLVGYTAETWNSKILAANGVPEIKEDADFSRGGSVAIVSALTLAVDDTSQLWKTLQDLGISLAGLRCEIIEFSQSVAVPATVTQTIRYHGVCKVDKWNEANYQIPIEPAILNRKSLLGAIVNSTAFPNADPSDIGKLIPVTLGQFSALPTAQAAYAKMVRTAKKDVLGYVGTLTQDNSANTFFNFYDYLTVHLLFPGFFPSSPYYASSFPIVAAGASPSLAYTIRLTDASATWGSTASYSPTNLYMKVISDTGSGTSPVGTYRKIATIQATNNAGLQVILTLSDNYPTDPVAESSGNGAWVSIYQIDRGFAFDSQPCIGFVDSDTSAVATTPELYVYESLQTAKISNVDTITGVPVTPIVSVDRRAAEYIRLASYMLEIASGSTNSLIIQPLLCENDPDSTKGFLIVPFTCGGRNASDVLRTISDTQLDKWLSTGWLRVQDGLFKWINSDPFTANADGFTNIDHAFDRDNSTTAYPRFIIYVADNTTANHVAYNVAIEALLPPCPQSFTFTKAYIALSMSDYFSPAGGVTFDSDSKNLLILIRKFLGDSPRINPVGTEGLFGNNTGELMNFPDFYFSPPLSTGNQNFFVATGSGTLIRGYQALDLQVSDVESYNNISKLGIFVHRRFSCPGDTHIDDRLYINELAVIFEKSCSYGDAVYTAAIGRIFNDTWGTRKTASLPVLKVRDMVEYVCRMQNYSDIAEENVQFGAQYSANALIKTGAVEGSFDDAELAAQTDSLALAWQITDESKAWSDAMKQELCSTAWLASYVDDSGYECVKYLPKVNTNPPTDIIDLGDIPKGYQIGEVEEPKEQDIYCNPIVNYNFDSGSGQFLDRLQILNVNLTSYAAATCQIGFNEVDGEHFWTVCKAIWDKYHIVQAPPSQLTDRYAIRTQKDAVWYLDNWISWMLHKRITVAVAYNEVFGSGTTPASWHIGRHVYLNLPHQTDGNNVESVIEKISKSLAKNQVEMQLIMLDVSSIPAGYYIKEVMYTKAQGADRDAKEMLSTTSPQMKEQM